MKAPITALASSSDWKRCTYKHSSFRVRMKRSIMPLHSGSPTNAGLERIPSQESSPYNWVASPVVPESKAQGYLAAVGSKVPTYPSLFATPSEDKRCILRALVRMMDHLLRPPV